MCERSSANVEGGHEGAHRRRKRRTGNPLSRLLHAAGPEVIGLSRMPASREKLLALGAD
ncbi:MAG TPA: hypothetical protein VKA82_21970 [Rubrobacter sp.]|nr:hypothetical protein [Rubrobacter sp.]